MLFTGHTHTQVCQTHLPDPQIPQVKDVFASRWIQPVCQAEQQSVTKLSWTHLYQLLKHLATPIHKHTFTFSCLSFVTIAISTPQ